VLVCLEVLLMSCFWSVLQQPMIAKRSMANLSGSVIELSNYLEQKISQKSAEYAAVSRSVLTYLFD
jgi:hypothetical protein